MSVDSIMASKAYAEGAMKVASPGKGTEATAASEGGSFGALLKGITEDAASTGKAGEMQAMASVTGQAEMVDVVTAITAAEITLETVVAVRDKVMEAYQSIMRMPI
jgi:flagellar hook-basal body complex protein FliE